MPKMSLSQSGIYPHKPTWIHKPIPGKEMSVPKSPDIIGKGSPTASSPVRSPQSQKQDSKSPGIPTYVDIKRRLTEALREIEWYKSQQGITSSPFVTPEPQSKPKPKPKASVKAKIKAKAQTASDSRDKAKSNGKASKRKVTPAEEELSSEISKPVAAVESSAAVAEVVPEKAAVQEIQEIDTRSLDLYKKMLKETIHSLLSSGMFFSKIGRNGKAYARMVRWSSDMKSVEWFKSYNETPRFVLMNSLNNASVSLALDEHSNEICTLSSDHRTLTLVVETSSQRHWADLTQHVVENRSISSYLDSLS